MPRTHMVAAGARTRVFRRRFSSIPQTIAFSSSTDQGTVERVGSRWVLGRTHTTTPLQTENQVRKGYWDTFFEVFVTVQVPATITIERPRMRWPLLITGLVLLVVAVAVVLYFYR